MKRGVVLRSAWRIARAYWFSDQKATAWLLLIGVVGLNLTLVYITVQLNVWQGNFYTVIQEYDRSGFIRALGVYALLAVLYVVIRGVQVYVRMRLGINWRAWLTDTYLTHWLRHKTYYRLQLADTPYADNPDQRISEDMDLFVALTLRLTLDFLQDFLTVFSFVVILWNMSDVIDLTAGGVSVAVKGYLVWAALLYALAGTYWTARLGGPLVGLEYDQQRYEADFRFTLIRVREHAESIALYGGESEERQNCLRHFVRLADNFKRIINVRKQLVWLTTAYNQAAVVFAILVASPRYFSGKIHLGQMFQIIDAFQHVQSGFSFIIDSFSRLAQWRAVVNRLNHFLLCMEQAQKERARNDVVILQKQGGLNAAALCVYRPDGRALLRDLNLALPPGGRLLIAGPSGCGKSTLLKTFAGLWPYAGGRIAAPAAGRLFIPQRPYMPVAALRAAVAYPGVARASDDARLAEILTACNLEPLAGRLAEHGDWEKIFSLGEQQRIAFARMLYLRPDWLFLDEATSALDESNQEQMYGLLARRLPRTSIVSVGHRRSICVYHHWQLTLDGAAGWRLTKLK